MALSLNMKERTVPESPMRRSWGMRRASVASRITHQLTGADLDEEIVMWRRHDCLKHRGLRQRGRREQAGADRPLRCGTSGDDAGAALWGYSITSRSRILSNLGILQTSRLTSAAKHSAYTPYEFSDTHMACPNPPEVNGGVTYRSYFSFSIPARSTRLNSRNSLSWPRASERPQNLLLYSPKMTCRL
jgi:hypothetical protein